MGEPTALILLEVLAGLALQPELAQLSLDLLLPEGLRDRLVRSEGLGALEVHNRRVEIFTEALIV